MKKKWLAGVLALVLVCGAGLPVSAAENPTLSKTSETQARASAYQYWLFDPEKPKTYLNEVYCSVEKLTVQADNGKFYTLVDPTALQVSADFSCSLKSTANAHLVKKLRVAQEEMQKPGEPSYAIRLGEDAVLDKLSLGFSVTYTAKADTTLRVREAGKTDKRELTVKRGAKLVFSNDLLVDYQKLVRFDVTTRYAQSLDSLRKNPWPMGVSGDVMTPETDRQSDYTWSSLGRLCAEIELGTGSLSGAPKLSTLWSDGELRKRFVKGEAFIRSFAKCTVDGKVTLTMTNPFMTLDGEESIPHENVKIYTYQANGKLTDVTKSFRYTTDSDGNGAFSITTSELGQYIISNIKA